MNTDNDSVESKEALNSSELDSEIEGNFTRRVKALIENLQGISNSWILREVVFNRELQNNPQLNSESIFEEVTNVIKKIEEESMGIALEFQSFRFKSPLAILVYNRYNSLVDKFLNDRRRFLARLSKDKKNIVSSQSKLTKAIKIAKLLPTLISVGGPILLVLLILCMGFFAISTVVEGVREFVGIEEKTTQDIEENVNNTF